MSATEYVLTWLSPASLSLLSLLPSVVLVSIFLFSCLCSPLFSLSQVFVQDFSHDICCCSSYLQKFLIQSLIFLSQKRNLLKVFYSEAMRDLRLSRNEQKPIWWHFRNCEVCILGIWCVNYQKICCGAAVAAQRQSARLNTLKLWIRFPLNAGLLSLSILSNVALNWSLEEVLHYCFS